MKRVIIALALCLALLSSCAFAETATKEYQLGTSVYVVQIPESYTEGERTDKEITDDMVAYMHSPDTLLDFDVYQFSKEG